MEAGEIRIKETRRRTLYAAPPCVNLEASIVSCAVGDQVKYLMAWGDAGNDVLRMIDEDDPRRGTERFPRDFTAHLDGGEGNDYLFGGDGDDVLFTGRNGEDRLHGGRGDDALISETYETTLMIPSEVDRTSSSTNARDRFSVNALHAPGRRAGRRRRGRRRSE